MNRILIPLLALAGVLTAQEAAPRPKWTQKFIEVKSGNVNRMVNLLSSIPNLAVRGEPEMRVISIGSDNPDVLKAAEEAIARFDRPGAGPGSVSTQNFDLTIHLLLAGKEMKVGDALPPELEPVAKQLRSIFGFKDLQLLDSAFLRGRDDEAGELSGTAALEGAPAASTYNFKYNSARVVKDEKGTLVKLGRVSFGLRMPSNNPAGGVSWNDAGFQTSIDLRDGQKVVVGKSRVGGEQRSLIVVMTAKVAD